jgi:hypothetical protein
MFISSDTPEDAFQVYHEKLTAGESSEWKFLQIEIGKLIRYQKISRVSGRPLRFKRREYRLSFFHQPKKGRFFMTVFHSMPREGTTPFSQCLKKVFLPERPSPEEVLQLLQDIGREGLLSVGSTSGV